MLEGRTSRSVAFTSEFMTDQESTSVQCVSRKSIGHRYLLLWPDFLEVFDLVLHDYGSDPETQEVFDRKAIFDQEHLAYVGSLVEVCRVLHVGVEVHIGPTGVKRRRVPGFAVGARQVLSSSGVAV